MDAERSALRAGDGVPVYGTPEEAARALGHAVRYARWRRRRRRTGRRRRAGIDAGRRAAP